jgi:hypothetical protein
MHLKDPGRGLNPPPLVVVGGLPSTFFSADGVHSRISGTASQGTYRQYFLALMMGAPGSPAPPPTGSAVDIF